MTTRTPGCFALLVFLFALAACGKSEVETLHDQYAEQALATIATLERLGAEQTLPDVDASSAWRDLAFDLDRALVYYRDGLADLTGEPDLANPNRSEFGLGSMIAFVRSGELDEAWLRDSRDYVEGALSTLAEPSAIIVIDPVAVRPGELVYANGEVTAFEPGRFDGAAHFFDAGGEHLGGFTFTARHPSQMRFVGRAWAFERSRETLEGSLYRCAWQAFREQLAAAFPNDEILVRDDCSPDE